MFVGIDAGGMAVGKGKLYRILPDRRGRLRARLGLEHRQRRGRCKRRRSLRWRLFLDALVVAGRARTVFSQIRKIKMTGVAVGPGDIHTRAGSDMNLHAGGFAALIDGNGHGLGK